MYIRKKRKLLSGIYLTFVSSRTAPYKRSWWDDEFYPEQIDDSATIVSGTNPLSAKHHYASIELLLTRRLFNIRKEVASVCDVGSGAGHWIEFYQSIGAKQITAVDVSSKAVRHLMQQYGDDESVTVVHGGVERVDGAERFDLVNAIGVMFHLVDDSEWLAAISKLAELLKPGGMLVVGGHFGLLDGVNVQFGTDGAANKRLRSAARWRKALRTAGLTNISIVRNNAYLFIDDPMPESNLLFAIKS